MNVLWITNMPFSFHNNLLGRDNGPMPGGSWLVAAYEGAKSDKNINLSIVTVSNVRDIQMGVFDGATFIVLPGGDMRHYDISNVSNIDSWTEIKNKLSPDVVIVWGTESKFAYTAMRVFDKIPKCIYIQGVVQSIWNHYYDGIPFFYKVRTIRDIVDLFDKKSNRNFFRSQVALENAMLSLAQGVIIENDWCESQCKSVNPRLVTFKNFLPIKKEFYDVTWNAESFVPYTIFTNAGGYPIKGHHILFSAIAIVKRYYPKVKVFIPGNDYIVSMNTVKRQTGYYKLINSIYKKNNLAENIEFVGVLTSAQMAERISTCNVYVMPSMIENHSSSLIEAMIVGAPCISSLAGGSAGIVQMPHNGYLYNSLEPITLAGYIMKIFADRNLARQMSTNTQSIRIERSGDFGKEISSIYKTLVNSNMK